MASYDVFELFNSREGSRGGSSPTELFLYAVAGLDGDENEAGARAAVLGVAPAIVDGLHRQSISHKQRGGLHWLFEVSYGVRPKNEGQTRITIDVTTRDEKRLVSLETIASYKATGDARDIPDFHGAINVSKGKVSGCMVPVGQCRVTISKMFKSAELTFGMWAAALALANGTENDATFYGFPAGTLSFRGSTINYIYDVETDPEEQQPIEVPFHFEFSPNVEGLLVQGIEVEEKTGFQYIWPLFEDQTDADAKALIVKPRAIYVERVLEPADYSALGIGTGV